MIEKNKKMKCLNHLTCGPVFSEAFGSCLRFSSLSSSASSSSMYWCQSRHQFIHLEHRRELPWKTPINFGILLKVDAMGTKHKEY